MSNRRSSASQRTPPPAQKLTPPPAQPEAVDPDAESTLALGLDIVTNPLTGETVLRLTPPDSTPSGCNKATDVVCVIDISGSMADGATVQNDAGKSESHGLSLLDVVKHAAKTVSHMLTANDRLAVVSFSSNARVEMNLRPMDPTGRTAAVAVLDGLDTEGNTNLWDGLHTAMELLKNRTGAAARRNASILLLTDGQPNVEPPRGHIPALKSYLDEFSNFNVYTYGFGYNLNSGLLKEIADVTGGLYVFIPDSGLVGTAFVNTVANIQATAITSFTLSVDTSEVGPVVEADSLLNVSASGACGSLGSVQYGQAREVYLRVDPQPKATGPIVARVKFLHNGTQHQVDAESRVSSSAADALAINTLRCRHMYSKFITDSAVAFAKGTQVPMTILEEPLMATTESPLVEALRKDLGGEVKMCLTDNASFTKWGRHYLLSLVGANLMQQCTNFKDFSVQLYGGALFNRLRDAGEKVFIALPPPVPKRPVVVTTTRSGQAVTRQAAPANMAAYYNCRGGCVTGDSLVAVAGGHAIAAQCITPGTVLANGATVRCVVRIACPRRGFALVEFATGLKITEYHPVHVDGEWRFPVNCRGVTRHADVTAYPYVYTFVLDGQHQVSINGIDVVTLGHGKTDNEVVAHEYLGTEAVVRDLAQLDGFDEGFVTVGAFHRDLATMRIIGLSGHSEVGFPSSAVVCRCVL